MNISKSRERSYWECEWTFPPTGTVVLIILPECEAGPTSESRRFYLTLAGRFPEMLAALRPKLEQFYRNKLREPVPHDVFSALKLTGLGLQDPDEQRVRWDVSFETKSDRYLGISIPFIGNTAMEPEVDTR